MIFDEIDRGVGGATADAVGRRLARLAEDGQILVVTHSPQVAALAGHHWVVEKSSAGGKTVTQLIESGRIKQAAEDWPEMVVEMPDPEITLRNVGDRS